MTGLLTLFGLERSIFHLPPADTLLSSVRQTRQARALPPIDTGVHNGNMFIVHFDRSDPTGRKTRKRTSYPIALDQNTYHLACGKPMVHPLTLQAVIVHSGQEVTKGHYVVFTKMAGNPVWGLCNDDKVQWVSEMEALAQEAFILIYAQPDAPQLTRAEQPTDQTTASMQPGTVICNGAAHPHSDANTNPLPGLETLVGKTTKHDIQPPVEENSRLEYDIENGGSGAEGAHHVLEEREPLPTSLSSSLPHHRSEVDGHPSELEQGSSDDQLSNTEKNSSGYEEQRPAQSGSTHKEQRQLTPARVSPLAHNSSSGSPNSSVLQSSGEFIASCSESPGKCWSKELDQRFQSALQQKLSRSVSTWISATSLMQWLQGTNRTRPCRLLSPIDTKALLTELKQTQGFSSLLQSYPVLEWKTAQHDMWFKVRPPSNAQLTEPTGTRRAVAPSPVASRRQKPMSRLRDNPTDRTTSESTDARLDLVDWCVANRARMTPSLTTDQDRIDWLEKRLRWNVIGILRDPSAATSLAERLYLQGRQWYQEQRVGSFLDKVRIRARAPELVRVTQKPLAKICVSNIYARSQLDIQSRLHSIGITIIQDLHAVFEIQYTTKLRIQSASLSVWVQSDQKLTDLLQGITFLDGILGPATITLIEDDSEVIHQMELKPNKQIDRRGMPFLTNIWSTLGASEAQILTWILLCTSSQLGQQWTAESAFLAHPDGPAHLPTIWGRRDQRGHRGHLLLQSETPAVP